MNTKLTFIKKKKEIYRVDCLTCNLHMIIMIREMFPTYIGGTISITARLSRAIKKRVSRFARFTGTLTRKT